MRKPIKNIGASVRARLLALAKAKDQPFDLILTRYTLERLLYRLSISAYRNRFILKDAMLLVAVLDDPFRPTRDLDLLGFGDSTPDGITAAFQDICGMDVDDAVIFDVAAITVDRLRDDNAYGGLRIGTYANVDGARVRVIVDIGFGDAVEPSPVTIALPVLLDQPAAKLLAYPYEVVVAEKFQAMVALGLANTRLKDFYDIWFLSRVADFDREKLARAIAATFDRRHTEIPTALPDALTPAFGTDPGKQTQWKNFVRDVAHDPGSLEHVASHLAAFLMPIAAVARALSLSKTR